MCFQMPSNWKHVEIDLMGPFVCRGEKNPRVTLKKWAAVIEDVYSGAVHCDVVDDYSAAAVIATIRKFAALRGWPSVVSSDPGSQLVSAGGKLESWYQENLCKSSRLQKSFVGRSVPPTALGTRQNRAKDWCN